LSTIAARDSKKTAKLAAKKSGKNAAEEGNGLFVFLDKAYTP
jgi:hypothetical protein